MSANKSTCRICKVEKDQEKEYYKRSEKCYYSECKQCRNRMRYPDSKVRTTKFKLMTENTLKEIAELVQARSLTRKQIAEKFNINYHTLTLWISSKKLPTPE